MSQGTVFWHGFQFGRGINLRLTHKCTCFKAQLLMVWESICQSDASLKQQLSEFYDTLLSTWHTQLQWSSQVNTLHWNVDGFHCHTLKHVYLCVCRSLKTPLKCSQCWWSRRWGRWCHLSQTALLWHWSVALATVVWTCCWSFIRRRLTSVAAWRRQCSHSSVCICMCEYENLKKVCVI